MSNSNTLISFSMGLNISVLLLSAALKKADKGFVSLSFLFKGVLPPDTAELLGLLLSLNKSQQMDFDLSKAQGKDCYRLSKIKRVKLLSIAFPKAEGKTIEELPKLLRQFKNSLGSGSWEKNGKFYTEVLIKPEACTQLLTILVGYMDDEIQEELGDISNLVLYIKEKREVVEAAKEKAREGLISPLDVFRVS